MKTKIREYRRRNRLTLQELASMVGTTPQTVQRLETANMTVSTDWLKKFADAFKISPADLLQVPTERHIPLLGTIDREAIVENSDLSGSNFVKLDIPAEQPLAVRLGCQMGSYPSGALLIANRLDRANLSNAHERDCIIATQDEQILLRRAIYHRDGTFMLVPLESGSKIIYEQKIKWIALIVMAVLYPQT